MHRRRSERYAITSRISQQEMIKVKGLQVAPAELEDHLLDHASVADAAVVGIPDDFAGELPLAFIVLQPGVSSAVQCDPTLADKVRSSIFEVQFIQCFMIPASP